LEQTGGLNGGRRIPAIHGRKKKFQAIKGTRDLLPPETELWNRVEQTAREVFGTFGYGEIRPPIFEPTELFARAVGFETDIVSKEMFMLKEQYDSQTAVDLARRETYLLGWLSLPAIRGPQSFSRRKLGGSVTTMK